MTRRSSNYPPELRERAVRMVAEVRPDYPSDWPAIVAVAAKLGIGTAETLRKWVRQAEVNAGPLHPPPVAEGLDERLLYQVAGQMPVAAQQICGAM